MGYPFCTRDEIIFFVSERKHTQCKPSRLCAAMINEKPTVGYRCQAVRLARITGKMYSVNVRHRVRLRVHNCHVVMPTLCVVWCIKHRQALKVARFQGQELYEPGQQPCFLSRDARMLLTASASGRIRRAACLLGTPPATRPKALPPEG